jgi:hypothetical protein
MDVSHAAVSKHSAHDGQGHAGRQPGAHRDPGRQAVRPVLTNNEEPRNGSQLRLPRTVVGAHYGTRDWLAQRVTAVLMALFTLVVLAQVLFSAARSATTPGAGTFAGQR